MLESKCKKNHTNMLYQKCALVNYVKMLLVCKIFYRVFLLINKCLQPNFNCYNENEMWKGWFRGEKISVIYLFSDTRVSGTQSKQITLGLGIRRG